MNGWVGKKEAYGKSISEMFVQDYLKLKAIWQQAPIFRFVSHLLPRVLAWQPH